MNNRASASLHGKFALLLLVLLCFILPRETLGQKSEGIDVAPEQEKRSCIQLADGYASLSDYVSLPEAKAAALANAKKEALEAAKSHIASRMKGGGLNETYESIWSDAEGAIVVLDQRDHGVKDKARYHVWIKAEVLYDLKPKKSAGSRAPTLGKDAPLTVKVWTPKKEYKAGESMKIYVQGNREFYGRIVYRTSSGEIIQLLPNEYRKSSLFELGEVYGIPDQDDQFGLTVTAPYGEDRIIVYASEVPLGEVNLEPVGQGLGRYNGSQKSLATTTREINMASSDTGAEFYEAVWAVETTCGGPTPRGTRKDGPEEPIHMTGAAGEKVPLEAPGDGTR
ncbi:MAG: DUF4384 domain-containing protein [Deltaproteobacteria bacterium]|nr:DUF4384 domain-containing protein [Deltaproteobacteria bacterium]